MTFSEQNSSTYICRCSEYFSGIQMYLSGGRQDLSIKLALSKAHVSKRLLIPLISEFSDLRRANAGLLNSWGTQADGLGRRANGPVQQVHSRLLIHRISYSRFVPVWSISTSVFWLFFANAIETILPKTLKKPHREGWRPPHQMGKQSARVLYESLQKYIL